MQPSWGPKSFILLIFTCFNRIFFHFLRVCAKLACNRAIKQQKAFIYGLFSMQMGQNIAKTGQNAILFEWKQMPPLSLQAAHHRLGTADWDNTPPRDM